MAEPTRRSVGERHPATDVLRAWLFLGLISAVLAMADFARFSELRWENPLRGIA